ncbi:hypothetical protein CDFC105_30785 [Clostridioides difficile]|nr:hypothetical protein CDFC105_30785 [Clostridioides difficile]
MLAGGVGAEEVRRRARGAGGGVLWVARRPRRTTRKESSAASDVYKRQIIFRRACNYSHISCRTKNRRVYRDRNKQKHHYLSLIHISEPTRLLSISYAVFCLKKKNTDNYLCSHDMSR